MTQDWHPIDHLSFASSHGRKSYDPYESEGLGPILWPDHCVQGSRCAEFHPRILTKFSNAIVRKGNHLAVDSYLAFVENDRKTPTGLSGYLETLGKNRIILCGLALYYCVYYSALDGKDLGFDVIVIVDLSKAIISPQGRLSEALAIMAKRGVQFTMSTEVLV